MKKVFVWFILLAFVTGCAPQKFEVVRPEPIDFPPVEKYSVQEDLASIPKPKGITRLYAKKLSDGKLELVDTRDEADFFVLAPSEMNKMNELKELAKAYKSIAIGQEHLVNLKNNTINELVRILKLTERERDVAMAAWENSENAYRQEKAAHEFDNRVNKTAMYILTVGSIVCLAIAL